MMQKLISKIYQTWFFWRWRRISRLRLSFYDYLIVKHQFKQKIDNSIDLENLRGKRNHLLGEAHKIIKIYENICKECGGKCCLGLHQRFSPLDSLFIPLDRNKINPDLYNPLNLILNRIKKTWDSSYRSYKTNSNKPCFYLTSNGCQLSISKRPLVCTMYFCKSFVFKMKLQDLKKLSKIFNGLENITIKAGKLRTKECFLFC